jgi:hypothetical protein
MEGGDSMDEYEKSGIEYSDQVVSNAEMERLKKERHQNRFNYYNCIIATLALIISIIALVLELCQSVI